MIKNVFLLSAIGVVWMVIASPLWAAGALDTFVYDPTSKSYFELIDGRRSDHYQSGYDSLGYSEGPTWQEAYSFARGRSYKGVGGRLAIVKSVATHEFLETTFHPDNYTWIGVRYWCDTHQLDASDGEHLTRSSFQAWDKNWKIGYACNSAVTGRQFMPVAYSPVQEGFRWIGQGEGKRYYYYIVEYPTGHP